MSATCPAGHESESTDYCDVCGLPMAGEASAVGGATAGESAQSAERSALELDGSTGGGTASGEAASRAASSEATAQTCPNCASVNPTDALFCEECGYDFTTGAMPIASPGGSSDDSLVIGPDGDGSASAGTTGQQAAVRLEWVAEVWVDPGWYELQDSDEPCPSPGPPSVVPLRGRSLLVGRPSVSRNIHPDVDLSGDPGISRRQAQLTTDGRRWWVEDLESSNGTFVAASSAPFPGDPIPPLLRHELGEDDRIYLGAWTRLVVRKATDEEAAQP